MPSPGLGASMRRRRFISLIGGAAAWPLAARAQKPEPVFGVLTAINLADWATDAIRSGLGEAGYVEGRNLTIVSLSAEGHFEGAGTGR
jgi:putative ABC transport system substrate-binding protein